MGPTEHFKRCLIATGRKTGGKDWQPGQSGNPAGRPGAPPDIKEARLQSKEKVERSLHALMFMTKDQIDAVLADPNTSSIDSIVAKIIERARETGDTFRANFILDRTIGKVTEHVSVDGSLHAALVAAIGARTNNGNQ